MTVGVATCSPETPVSEVARLLVEMGLEAVVVLDPGDGHALGVVSQDELLKAYPRSAAGELKAEEVMRDEVPQVPADIPLTAAAQIMQDLGVRCLFLMHHSGGIEYPAAMISYQHVLRHLAARNPDELRDLGIHAERQAPLDMFIQRREAMRIKNRSSQIEK
jgi:CBS domain-containing protein